MRSLLSKTPSGCVEYQKPVLEQSCVYEGTPSTTASSTATSMTTGTTVTTAPATTAEPTTSPFRFEEPADGATLRDRVLLRGTVSNAETVEYYLVPAGSNTYRYAGSGRLNGAETWVLEVQTTSFPNGEYYLRTRIKNQYGQYGSGQRQITIANTGGTTAEAPTANDYVPSDATLAKRQEFLVNLAESLSLAPDSSQSALPEAESVKRQILNYCEEQQDACNTARDQDGDGLSDIDEVRYGTDPKGADSDLDGFIDGDEVKNGFDPTRYSPGDQSDRIVFESPKAAGETKRSFVVETVQMKKTDGERSTLALQGKGLPNSFVTIYIYSDPIVLTVKTDEDGNWTYELDKELEDGQHEVYVAVTDNTGKITGKSEPLAFVKTAQAVTVIPSASAATNTESVTAVRTERDLLFLGAIILGAIAIALSTIGFIRHRHALAQDQNLIRPS